MNTFYMNGNYVSESNATISVNDLSVLRGYGIFDFMRTYNKVPFHLNDHIKRLQRSAKLLQMGFNTTAPELEEIILSTLSRNDHDESNIRIVITGGVSSDNFTPGDDLQTLVMVTPLIILPEEWYSDGAKVITSPTNRFIPGAKSINYIPGILCLKEAKKQDAIEAIYCDQQGYLLEGTTSNFFGIIGDTIITPPEDRILPGITRHVVLELAKQVGLVQLRNIHQDEIALLDEAFITASNKEVVPITAINSINISDGAPGSKTKQIMKLFADYTQDFKN